MKLNWGFGIAVVYVVFAVCMILFAIKASNQKYDLVSENYYEKAVNYQQTISAKKNAEDMQSVLSVSYLSKENAIKLDVPGINEILHGTLAFYKPDNAGDDFQMPFSIDESGFQIIPLKNISHGAWEINIRWTQKNKDCYLKKRIVVI